MITFGTGDSLRPNPGSLKVLVSWISARQTGRFSSRWVSELGQALRSTP